MGKEIEKLRRIFEPHRRPDTMKTVRTGKSELVRTVVEALVTEDDFEEQKEKVTSCILEAKALLEWYIEHHLVTRRDLDINSCD